MIINKEGDKLFIGDEEGKVSLVKLSKSFYSISSNSSKAKQAFLNSFLEREVNKEKAIDALLNLKGKKKVGKDDPNKQAKAEAALKERLRSIESDYMSFVNNMWNDTREDNKSNSEEQTLNHQTSYINATSMNRADNNTSGVLQEAMSKNLDSSKEKEQSKEASKIEEHHEEQHEESKIEEGKQPEEQDIYATEENNNERLNSSHLAAEEQPAEDENKNEGIKENVEEQVEEKNEEKVEENKEDKVDELKEEIEENKPAEDE